MNENQVGAWAPAFFEQRLRSNPVRRRSRAVPGPRRREQTARRRARGLRQHGREVVRRLPRQCSPDRVLRLLVRPLRRSGRAPERDAVEVPEQGSERPRRDGRRRLRHREVGRNEGREVRLRLRQGRKACASLRRARDPARRAHRCHGHRRVGGSPGRAAGRQDRRVAAGRTLQAAVGMEPRGQGRQGRAAEALVQIRPRSGRQARRSGRRPRDPGVHPGYRRRARCRSPGELRAGGLSRCPGRCSGRAGPRRTRRPRCWPASPPTRARRT